tara:strand:+ start:60648 stop:61136 length:489 start_codon:yes stop_codon:yes gene_type:complete
MIAFRAEMAQRNAFPGSQPENRDGSHCRDYAASLNAVDYSTLALCFCGLALARAVNSPAFSRQILSACRKNLLLKKGECVQFVSGMAPATVGCRYTIMKTAAGAIPLMRMCVEATADRIYQTFMMLHKSLETHLLYRMHAPCLLFPELESQITDTFHDRGRI